MLITALDSLVLLSDFAALVFLAAGWRRIPGADIRGLLACLLAVSFFHSFCVWSEWAGISHALEGYEDFSGALVPMLWAFLLYAWLQRWLKLDLARGEEKLRVTLDSIGDAVVATDRDGRVTRMNPIAERLTGWSLPEARGRPLAEVFEIVSAVDGRPAADPVARVLATGAVVGLANHTQLVARGGARTHIADSAAPIRSGDGETDGVVLVFRDVGEEYRLREKSRAAEERMDLALKGADLGTWDWDVRSGRVVFDDRWAEMLGLRPEEVEPRVEAWEERVHPDDLPQVRAALQAHLDGRSERYESEHRLRTSSGGWLWVLDKGRVIERGDDGRPLRACGTHLDLSERKRLEERMRRSGKMEAVGRLAGGVAHDLNNLLTPILGYGELLAADPGLDGERRSSVDEILRAGLCARDLVRQLLAFGRRQTLQFQPVDLSERVDGFVGLLRRTIPESVEIRTELSVGLPPVKADPGQLEQILMNLAVNAADAMPAGGLLSLETALAGRGGPDGEAGAFVRLRVRDTGAGMDAETRERAFEPFFSTKGERGSGLGLATVHGIVQQHGGSISLESEPGQGSCFEILLPAAVGGCAERSAAAPERPETGGSGTVLLVEDNEQVRRLARAVLERQGYRLLVAADGREALELLGAEAGPVQLLLTDVVMPGMNGRQLLEAARIRQPGLKALFMSGYTENVIADHGVIGEDVRFVQKPFSTAELARKVREALAGEATDFGGGKDGA